MNTGLTNKFVWSLAIDPANPTTLYAGTSGGVFKSTDVGTSWTAVNTGRGNTIVFSLAIDPTDTATIYAGTQAAGVFKSGDGAATWQPTGAN